jgi:hypothetical protein
MKLRYVAIACLIVSYLLLFGVVSIKQLFCLKVSFHSSLQLRIFHSLALAQAASQMTLIDLRFLLNHQLLRSFGFACRFKIVRIPAINAQPLGIRKTANKFLKYNSPHGPVPVHRLNCLPVRTTSQA